MGDGRIVKPVTAPRQDTVDLAYDASDDACAHRRRPRAVTLPRNRLAAQRDRFDVFEVEAYLGMGAGAPRGAI
jgi:hypothetical protein